MSLSDRFRSILKKDSEDAGRPKDSPAPINPTPPPVSPPKIPATPSPSAEARTKIQQTAEELQNLIHRERTEGESKVKALEQEIHTLRANLEKVDLASRNRREAHQQHLQYLQQDAEREIKFIERKLQEDSAAWTRQLAERDKALDQVVHQIEAGNLERKSAYEQEEGSRKAALERVEKTLKEYEAKLLEERQHWQDLLKVRDEELLQLKQQITQKEMTIEAETKDQEEQRKAAQELWQARLRELEKQWTDKRRAWEEEMKAKEEERLRVHTGLQERQAAWQLEQERRLQDMARRQERATEKASALQLYLQKEMQAWQQLVQERDEQLQQLKVKLLLSESDAKARAEQAQKVLEETIGAIQGQVQAIQRQFADEQASWKQAVEDKEVLISGVKDEMKAKLRAMETDYNQRLTILNAEKTKLTSQLQALQEQQKEAQHQFEERMKQLQEEQVALETNCQKRLLEIQQYSEKQAANIQAQMQLLEKQKEEAEKELVNLRRVAQEELKAKESSVKELQTSIATQEAGLKARFANEEDGVTRQIDALNSRMRVLDRELGKVRENLERIEREHVSAIAALEKEHQEKIDVMTQQAAEQEARLQKKLEGHQAALETFLATKKAEEAQIQSALKAKEKDRANLATRLAHLPEEYAAGLEQRKAAAQKEQEALHKQIAAAELELQQTREQSKLTIQAKATQLSALRQGLDAKFKEIAASGKLREQVWESELASTEKQMTAARAELDRIRTHWQAEIDKKSQEMVALEEEIKKAELAQRSALEQQQKLAQEQRIPLEQQRDDLAARLQREKAEHDYQMQILEKQLQECQDQIQKLIQKAQIDQKEQEARFRQERARWKAEFDSLHSEQEGVVKAGQEAVQGKAMQIEQLEEQLRQQAVAHEAQKRELIHNATVKTRTLQDIIHQIETELKNARESFPIEMRAREEKIATFNQQLANDEARHQHTLVRFERALTTLARRGTGRETTLRTELTSLKEEWSKKLAARDSEIAALQSSLMAKEAERQGELERMAKQFAEERFQLEKSKEELEWKLKDHKEVSERQLGGRDKEVHFLEGEINRLKVQRDQEISRRSSAFDAEKQKIQGAIIALQNQLENERKKAESTLAAKDQELEDLVRKSKDHLKSLGEEFNQKVNSWRATNEALSSQIEQLKMHWAQAQDHWDALRKEKNNQITVLRKQLTEWEVKLQTDYEELERVHEQDRQALLLQVRKREKDFEEMQAQYQRRTVDKEDEMNRAMEEIQQREAMSEVQWRATLEQWQADKLALEQEKSRLEQDLIQLQNRAETELHDMEETSSKIRMEITFKESQAGSQQDRMRVQMAKDLFPLKEKLEQLTAQVEQEKTFWESRIRSKEDDLKVVKARMAWREKRLQDELKRRHRELEGLRKQLNDEIQKARQRHETETQRIETMLTERRAALAALEGQHKKAKQADVSQENFARQALQTQRKNLEESIQQLLKQQQETKAYYERLYQEQGKTEQHINETLTQKDLELAAARNETKALAEELKAQVNHLRRLNEETKPAKQEPIRAAAWNEFEAGVSYFQAGQWELAARAFEESAKKDPHWGAAYQYLALSYHALNQDIKAAWAANQALEQDPHNAQLGAWVDRLRSSLELKDRPKAS